MRIWSCLFSLPTTGDAISTLGRIRIRSSTLRRFFLFFFKKEPPGSSKQRSFSWVKDKAYGIFFFFLDGDIRKRKLKTRAPEFKVNEGRKDGKPGTIRPTPHGTQNFILFD